MWSKSSENPPGVTGADHFVAAAFLCGDKPRKTTGADIECGTTIDQMIAQQIGRRRSLPSLQVAVEDPGANSSNCGEGYSCVYTNTISWAAPTAAADGGEPAGRVRADVRRRRHAGRAARAPLAAAQHPRLADGLALALRGQGRRVRSRARRPVSRGRARDRAAAADRGEGVDRGARDRDAGTACPIRSTSTSSCSSTCSRWRSRRHHPRRDAALCARPHRAACIPRAGTDISFHGGSHHAEDPGRVAQYAKLNQYHVKMIAYFVEKLRSIRDGDGTLLDHSLVLYGSNMGNSNQHLHYDVPHILIGGASGKLKGNRHLAFPSRTVPTQQPVAQHRRFLRPASRFVRRQHGQDRAPLALRGAADSARYGRALCSRSLPGGRNHRNFDLARRVRVVDRLLIRQSGEERLAGRGTVAARKTYL